MANLINIHTHNPTTQRNVFEIISLSFSDLLHKDLDADKYYSIGIHPWETQNLSEEAYQLIEKTAQLKNVLAIGEIGLDKLKGAHLVTQVECFERQIELANKYNKPIILHSVKAYSELLNLRKKHSTQFWIFHGFNNSVETASQAINLNCYLSFGQAILHENKKVKKALTFVPKERLFLETDEAENNIEEIYLAAAKIRSTSIDILRQQIFSNFEHLFV